MQPDVEYVGLIAEAWDALRGDTSGWPDRRFYLELIRESGEPVLDVGCGTGRLLLDFLALGIDIDGVDNSAEMLERCASKAGRLGLRPTLHLQSMAALELPRRYATVLVPSSTFQLLVEPADAREALRRFHRHLMPGGALVLPFIVMDRRSEERWVREATLGDGSVVRRTAYAVFDPGAGLESTDDLYEVFVDGRLVRSERHRRPRAARGYSTEEVAAMLGEAGFERLEWCSGFRREPFRDGDDIFTVIARAS